MARTALTDPDVIAAERERDRVALLVADGTAPEQALERAEAELTRAHVAAERRRERPAAVARQRAELERAEAEKRARWAANHKAIEEILVARYCAAGAVDDALHDLVAAVEEWIAIPALAPLLIDAPTEHALLARRRAPIEALSFRADEVLRGVAHHLGMKPAPLAPEPFRASLQDIWESYAAPLVNVLEAEPKPARRRTA